MTAYHNSNLRQRIAFAVEHACRLIEAEGHDKQDAIAEACKKYNLRPEQSHRVERKLDSLYSNVKP